MLNLARLDLQVEHYRVPDLAHGDIVNFEAARRVPDDGRLQVLVILGVFLFHAVHLFDDLADWHFKSEE
jgi:hypothetical protein